MNTSYNAIFFNHSLVRYRKGERKSDFTAVYGGDDQLRCDNRTDFDFTAGS
jgi:hypothetical protein